MNTLAEDFEIEVINPKSREQEIALFNARHPEQFTFEKLMTEEIAEKWANEILNEIKNSKEFKEKQDEEFRTMIMFY